MKNDRLKYNTVLIIDVHARDIVDGFVRDRYVQRGPLFPSFWCICKSEGDGPGFEHGPCAVYTLWLCMSLVRYQKYHTSP